MCADERFGVFKYGNLGDIDWLNPVSLWRYYREILSINPVELYVVGDLDAKQVEKVAWGSLPMPLSVPATLAV